MSIPAIESKLNDIAGVRVIRSFTQDVYKLVDALLAQVEQALKTAGKDMDKAKAQLEVSAAELLDR